MHEHIATFVKLPLNAHPILNMFILYISINIVNGLPHENNYKSI